MKIVKIIHGYPMRYNAGSEVYSQMLCQGLASKHNVHVFTREEDPFIADYAVKTETDKDDPRVTLHIINLHGDRQRYRYQHQAVDQQFANLLDKLQPDIIHIGHLNHLSTSLVYEAYNRKIPIVYTLHDYWLMCPRGQFMQRLGIDNNTLWPVCDGQEDRKCATHCYAGCASGANETWEHEINYWQNWIKQRMLHMQQIVKLVDYFIAPSRYLYNRFVNDFGLPVEKITYLDYGFDLKRFTKPQQRIADEPFTFGYIGTHIPAKGIQHLIEAFGLLKGDCLLRLWGRPNQNTSALKTIIKSLPVAMQNRIEWKNEYRNADIVMDVFNKTDCIAVPSIWVENSPLVIHEALQARVPVITADVGGMAEYIHHEINGLLFKHRDVPSLAKQMQRLLDNPPLAKQLGSKGYLQSDDGNIPDMPAHLNQIEQIYQNLVTSRSKV